MIVQFLRIWNQFVVNNSTKAIVYLFERIKYNQFVFNNRKDLENFYRRIKLMTSI